MLAKSHQMFVDEKLRKSNNNFLHFLSNNNKKIQHHRQIDGLAPTFIKKPAIRQEDDGKRLLFECLIKADPVPQVRWSHNGSPVEDDARHKVSK